MTEQSLKNKTIQRNSNLELYRIIVMLLIVAHHYVVNSGVLEIASEYPTSLRSLYYYLFGAWGKVGINCFVLITGYFMCERHITFRKFIKLLFEVVFYMVFINAVLIIAGIEIFPSMNCIVIFNYCLMCHMVLLRALFCFTSLFHF